MGFRIVRDIARPDPDVLERLRPIPSSAYAAPATLGESVAVDPAIRPLLDSMRVIGPAFTVLATSGDLLMPMYATQLAQAGDVLVIDAGGRDDLGFWGWPQALSARFRGLAGIVLDGAVFDSPRLAALELPTFARSSTPISGTAERPGSINVTVRIGGKVVNPGDLIVGDADGLVVIPRRRAPEVAELVGRYWAEVEGWHEGVRQGRTVFETLGLAERVERLHIVEEPGPGRSALTERIVEVKQAVAAPDDDPGASHVAVTDQEGAALEPEPGSLEPDPPPER